MKLITLLAASAVLLAPLRLLAPPAASFSYQGYLADANAAATGNYYFSFSIYAAANGGAALATHAPGAPLPVNQGYFQTVISHAAAPALFADGQVKYLEIRVRRLPTDAWTTLSPRQEVHPSPMAQNAEVLVARHNTFTGINTFNQNVNIMEDALLSGPGSQLRITTDEQFAMTIDGSSPSGTWLTLINQRSVLSQNDNPHEWNLIASGVSNTEGARKLLLRDGTAGAVRLTVDSAGDVGIGTSDPQGKLEVATGSGRTLRIRDDLVPTLEPSGAASDGLRGYMRMRNVLEVWPRADGSAAGKLDVRNSTGAPTITLNGSDGSISAGSISAANMPAIKYTQVGTSPRGTPSGSLNPQQNRDIDTLDVTAPAAGFIMVQATVQTGGSGGNAPFDTGAYFKLLAGPPGGTLVEQLENGTVNSASGYTVIPINWVIPVTAGQQLRLVTNLYNRSGSGWNYFSHTLHALFIPNQIQ